MTETIEEKQKRAEKLALDVLKFSRNSLLVNMRFLDVALSRLDCEKYDGTVSTDGVHIYYNVYYILKVYKSEREEMVRTYLHMLMHCIFRHMYVFTLVDEELWDLACDIAVEYSISELGISMLSSIRSLKQQQFLDQISKHINLLTAEKIYHHLVEHNYPYSEIEKMKSVFSVDEHSIWHKRGNEGSDANDDSDSKDSDDSESNSGSRSRDNNYDDSSYSDADTLSAIEDWKEISEQIQTALETIEKQRGDQAGGFIQNLKSVNREKYDYTSFLKKFAVLCEAMKVNDDEFDYIFYTYGLNLYGNVPLIEPLEYKETKRIREFVIAIDTSGSVQGEEVQRFVQKTYNILMSTESFASKINLHIIQCDAAIQEHVKITSRDEFNEYLKNMKLCGFGGTDFRPVFNAVNDLIEEKEFTNLKGLIYFTDGYGVFPKNMPPYKNGVRVRIR